MEFHGKLQQAKQYAESKQLAKKKGDTAKRLAAHVKKMDEDGGEPDAAGHVSRSSASASGVRGAGDADPFGKSAPEAFPLLSPLA